MPKIGALVLGTSIPQIIQTFENIHSLTTSSLLVPKIGALVLGMRIPQSINDKLIFSDVVVSISLVDIHANYGSMHITCMYACIPCFK